MQAMSRHSSTRSLVLAALACTFTFMLAACGSDVLQKLNPFTSEREALVDLYKATGGDGWRNNSGWLTDQHIETWHGVVYFRASYQRPNDPISGGPQSDRTVELVQELALSGNSLSGEIPSDWGGLKNLRILSLRNNQLTGEIPSDLGKLDKLRKLDLGNNQLSGEIPPELGNIGPELQSLILRGNQLTGEIPPELTGLRDLVALDLRNNQLSGPVPGELGRFRRLQWLYLRGNQFTGCIPSGLRNTPNHDFLALGLPYCGTGELPGDEATRKLLAFYNATGGDEWTEDTKWLTNAPISRWFGLSNSGGASPRTLTSLELPDNNLTGEIPPELGYFRGLQILDLRDNNLTGELPPELGNLQSLLFIYLDGNDFSGCIPPGWIPNAFNDLAKLGLPNCPDSAAIEAVESDRDVLVALYDATGGEDWHESANWLSSEPIDQWSGTAEHEIMNLPLASGGIPATTDERGGRFILPPTGS